MIYLKGLQDFAVTVGTVTLHLDEYCITGGALLRESGNAEGSAAVTALYPKGTRLKLKGKLAAVELCGCRRGARCHAA